MYILALLYLVGFFHELRRQSKIRAQEDEAPATYRTGKESDKPPP